MHDIEKCQMKVVTLTLSEIKYVKQKETNKVISTEHFNL